MDHKVYTTHIAQFSPLWNAILKRWFWTNRTRNQVKNCYFVCVCIYFDSWCVNRDGNASCFGSPLKNEVAQIPHLFCYLFHPHVTTVAWKRSRSFCQKCRWQVSTKQACTLCIWFCMKWRDTVHGCTAHTEHAEIAAVTGGTSHVTIKVLQVRHFGGYENCAMKSLSFIQNHVQHERSKSESGEQHYGEAANSFADLTWASRAAEARGNQPGYPRTNCSSRSAPATNLHLYHITLSPTDSSAWVLGAHTYWSWMNSPLSHPTHLSPVITPTAIL